MGRLLLTSHSLLAALFLSTTTSASSLFIRQSTCPADFAKCPQASIPSNFCCPSTSTCIPLAANTTVLCCPAGNDCKVIQSITCDISLQDASANPNSTLKTTALEAPLGKCGTKCCPFGYSCNKDNNCVRDANQDISPIPSSSSTSTTAPTSAPTNSIPTTTNPSPTAAPNTSESPSSTALPVQECPRFPLPSILIFFFAGLATGIALTILAICIFGTLHRKHTQSKLRRASTQSFGNIAGISSPHLQNESAARTDFLRKKEWDGSSSPSTLGRPGTIKRVRSMFSRDKTPGIGGRGFEDIPALPVAMPGPLNIQKQNVARKVNPVTPPQQRQPSVHGEYGDIMVYTDGETASALRQGSNAKETGGGGGLGIGSGNTMTGGGLLPPPTFLGDRGSGQTTFTALIEKSRDDGAANGRRGHERTSSGLAGLQKGQPYVYKGSPGYSDTSRSTKV